MSYVASYDPRQRHLSGLLSFVQPHDRRKRYLSGMDRRARYLTGLLNRGTLGSLGQDGSDEDFSFADNPTASPSYGDSGFSPIISQPTFPNLPSTTVGAAPDSTYGSLPYNVASPTFPAPTIPNLPPPSPIISSTPTPPITGSLVPPAAAIPTLKTISAPSGTFLNPATGQITPAGQVALGIAPAQPNIMAGFLSGSTFGISNQMLTILALGVVVIASLKRGK